MRTPRLILSVLCEVLALVGLARPAVAQCNWSGVGTATIVRALTFFDDGTGPALYAGGSFIAAGGVEANYVAKWDGAEWSPLGGGVAGRPPALLPSVSALAVYDDGTGPALCVGGMFVTAGDVGALSIARWDGAQWSALGIGMSGYTDRATVIALTVHDDGTGASLYAGGNFLTV